MHILMGLGNPGPKYDHTRHNIGFAVVDRFIQDVDPSGTWKSDVQNQSRKLALSGKPLLVSKPQTFMNLSGEAALSLLSFYKVSPKNLIVVVDDLYLDLGSVRIRAKGGHGGHNGLRNIIDHCGDEFVRIRVGVGPCPDNEDHADFVLKRCDEKVWRGFDPLFQQFKELIETGLTLGWEKAGSAFNKRASKEP